MNCVGPIRTAPLENQGVLRPGGCLTRMSALSKLFAMRRMLIISLIIGAGLILPPKGAAVPMILNYVIAIVNDEIVTYEDVMLEIQDTLNVLSRQYANDPQKLAEMRQKALRDGIEALVERKLILKEFEDKGYILPEDVLEDYIQEEIRDRFGDRVNLIKTLEKQGKTYESYREEWRERYIVGAMTRQNVSSDVIIVSPYKIQRYYLDHMDEYQLGDQVKLRMIVISGQKNGARAEALAREIEAKLDEGASFEAMAKIYSDGTQGPEGGDWGWIERSVLRPELNDAAFSLKPGQRGDIIELGGDYYIMLVEAKRSSYTKPLEEIREEIENTLIDQERQRRREQWIERLKAKAYIRYPN